MMGILKRQVLSLSEKMSVPSKFSCQNGSDGISEGGFCLKLYLVKIFFKSYLFIFDVETRKFYFMSKYLVLYPTGPKDIEGHQCSINLTTTQPLRLSAI